MANNQKLFGRDRNTVIIVLVLALSIWFGAIATGWSKGACDDNIRIDPSINGSFTLTSACSQLIDEHLAPDQIDYLIRDLEEIRDVKRLELFRNPSGGPNTTDQ